MIIIIFSDARGVHPPWGNDAISPCFRFISALFPTKISDSMENFLNFTFSKNCFWFSSAKISDNLFLVIHYKFWIPPIFAVSVHFSPYFRKIIISLPPTFANFPLWFCKIYEFFYILCVFRFPPRLTMMHLCITQSTSWMPLSDADEAWVMSNEWSTVHVLQTTLRERGRDRERETEEYGSQCHGFQLNYRPQTNTNVLVWHQFGE